MVHDRRERRERNSRDTGEGPIIFSVIFKTLVTLNEVKRKHSNRDHVQTRQSTKSNIETAKYGKYLLSTDIPDHCIWALSVTVHTLDHPKYGRDGRT